MESAQWIHRGEDIPIPELKRHFGRFMWERIRSHDTTKPFQIDGVTNETMTGEQLLARAVSVAEDLRHRGIMEGDVVSTALHNCIDASCILFGTLFAGAVYAPFNPDLHSDDLRYITTTLSPRVVFSAPKAAAALSEVLPQGVEVVEVREGNAPWDALRRGASPATVNAFKPAENIDIDGPITILCSSGTSGKPKGVMISSFPWFSLMIITEKLSLARNPPEVLARDVTLMVTPNFWISGMTAMITCSFTGRPLVILPSNKMDIPQMLGTVQKHRVTVLTVSSAHIAAIAKHPKTEDFDVSSVRLFGFGGSSISPVLQEVAGRRLGKRLTQYYAQTESIVVVLPGPKSAEKPGTVGRAAVNVALKVVNYETGKAVGPNSEGEICVKSRMLFSGYYKNPKATVEAIDEDGWLHTGDVGYFDEEGYFFICDRYKELIKYKGNHIAPSDIEHILVNHESVKDAAVVGIDHDEDTEHPVAFVELQHQQTVTAEELLKLIKDQLPEYKHLHGGLHFIKGIPYTASGKVKRKELRQIARGLKDEK